MTKITLEYLMTKTREDGDCMVWTGKVSEAGHPILFNTTGRRKVWSLVHGDIPAGMLVGVDCGCKRCLNPEHLVLMSRSDVSRISNNRPDVKARRAIANAKTARITVGKISMGIAREIRAGDKPGRKWAAELGCSESLVSLVRRNKSWVEIASPWSGLGKRAVEVKNRSVN